MSWENQRCHNDVATPSPTILWHPSFTCHDSHMVLRGVVKSSFTVRHRAICERALRLHDDRWTRGSGCLPGTSEVHRRSHPHHTDREVSTANHPSMVGHRRSPIDRGRRHFCSGVRIWKPDHGNVGHRCRLDARMGRLRCCHWGIVAAGTVSTNGPSPALHPRLIWTSRIGHGAAISFWLLHGLLHRR